jgi:hypothetical protein
MKELFKNQLNGTQPLTKNILSTLHRKEYFNGDEKQIGDVVLFAMLMGKIIEKEGEYPELPIKLITLNERHFDLFTYDKTCINNDLPIIMPI